jgi:hypothetical protein
MSQQINLFNPVFLRQKKHFSAVTMLQALVIVLAGSLAMYAYQVRQNGALERALADTDKQVAARRDQMVKFSREFSDQGRSRALADEAARVEERLRLRRGLLEELSTGVGGNTEGFSTYLSALARQTMNGVWLTGVAIGGKSNDLVIRGRVLDSGLVPAYIKQLSREEPLVGRSVAELKLEAKDEAARPAAPGAQAPAGPARYVEFSFSIPLGGAAARGPAGANRGAS